MAQENVNIPIAGKITGVNVKPGDMVKEGDTLCLLESMKMENPILSPVSGKVTKVGISVGQVVETGELVAIIEH